MKDADRRKIAHHQPRDPLPARPVFLAAPPKRAMPEDGHVVAKGSQPLGIGGHRVICKVAAYHLSQPAPLFRNRNMHPPTQFSFKGLELYPHPIPASLPLKLEVPRSRASADVRKPQKVERLRLAKATLLSVGRRMAAKLDEARLV